MGLADVRTRATPTPGRCLPRTAALCATGVLATMPFLVTCVPNGPSPPRRPATWTYDTEEQWTLASVAESIEALAAFARRSPGALPRQWRVHLDSGPGRDRPVAVVSPPAAPRYTLHFGWEPREYVIEIPDHVWSSDIYVALARSRLQGAPHSEGNVSRLAGDDLLASLADLRVPVLQEQNKRLSESLAQDRLDPELHEEAALLLGAFALREEAGSLSDDRYALCRMAAHLALARGLRNGENVSLSGRVAEILVLTLIGRQKDAVDALGPLEATSTGAPGIGAWIRALRLRNTGDWRRHEGRSATRVEQIEEFRALRHRLPSDAAERYLDEIGAPGDTMWHRLMFSGEMALADCALFSDTAVPAEVEEVKAVWAGFGDAPPSNEAAMAAGLNETPAPGGVRRSPAGLDFSVLDRGLWAAFLQRHLCGAVSGTSFCYRYVWGDAEAAAGYSQEARRRFSDLTLFPFVAVRLASDDAASAQAFASAVRVLETAPEQTTAASWLTVRNGKPRSFRGPVPDPSLWFAPPFPRNTVFDMAGRFHELDAIKVPLPEQHTAWHAIAPYDHQLSWYYLWQAQRGRGPAREMMEGSALFLDYDAWMLARVVEQAFDQAKTDPATHKDVGRRLGKLNPDYWATFGYQLVSLGDAAGAAEAFRAMLENCRDPVLISNSLGWLVFYELEHGRTQAARQLAERAAATYSEGGLETMALFQEKTGHYDRALEYFRMPVERYEHRTPLVAFYLRNERRFRGTPVEREVQPVLDEVFPRGLQNARREEMTGPPESGLLVEGNPWDVRQTGLLIQDIIVGINGKHVRNLEQYRVLVDLDPWSLDGRKSFLLWRNDRYIDLRIYPSDFFRIRPYP